MTDTKADIIMSCFEYEYSLVESDCEVDGYKYRGYGICVRKVGTEEARSFFDISTRRGDVLELVDRCNRLALDPIHIEDVIDDFLCVV